MARLRFVPPQLATLSDESPTGEGWIHEVKHDGYRTQLIVDDGGPRLLTRNGHDWTDRYRSVALAADGLACREAIVDSEMVVQDARGVTRRCTHASSAAYPDECLVTSAITSILPGCTG